MSCFNNCGCIVPLGVINKTGLPAELLRVLEDLRNRGANMNAQAIFTFFWVGHSDLDTWVRHKETGQHVSYTNKNNSILGLTLDVDANAGGQRLDNPIENIGVIKSDTSPDGTYELYLDNYNNRRSGDNYFNVLVAFKREGQEQFENVAWFRNTTSFDPPRYNGNYDQMLHVLDVIKNGQDYKVTNLTTSLQPVYLRSVDII